MASAVPSPPNPLSARFVATWQQDCSGWAVEHHEPGAAPASAEAYVDGLPTRSPSTTLASFLGQASPMAVFELDCDGVRKAVGLKLMSVESNPVMVRQPLTGGTEMRELDKVHPVLMRLDGLATYHWGTPAFLDLCEVLGLDPKAARPRFRARFQGLAEELLRWRCTVSLGADASWESPGGKARQAVSMALEMMRADAYPGPGHLDRLRDRWAGMDRSLLPRVGELDRLVNSDELLDTAGLDAGVVPPREMPATGVAFLPSRHGAGYTATISGYWGQHEPDGWVADGYGDLRGIAIEPDRDMLAEQAWLRAVVRRLRGQGVLFLSMAEARAYLASNEAAYWICRAGGTPLSVFARRAAPWQRLLWRLLPPALPRDRELAARLGVEPHDRPNRPSDRM